MSLRSLLVVACCIGIPSLATGGESSGPIGLHFYGISHEMFRMGQDGPAADYKMTKHPAKFDDADWDERPAHNVTVRPIGISEEVTLGQFRKFRPDHLRGRGDDRDAVTYVSWHDAVAFCRWLSEHHPQSTYRLPTEAEWECACRMGTKTLFNTGDKLPPKSHGWFGEIGYRERYFTVANASPEYRIELDSKPDIRVGQRAMPFVPSDLHGNVAEWCADWYGPYSAETQIDPQGPPTGDFRVIRGGSHTMFTRLLRSANRMGWLPEAKNGKVGFRVVIEWRPYVPPTVATTRPAAKPDAATVQGAVAGDPIPFAGPKPFVKVSADAYGPMFIWHNHSPAIVECKNGDLLAVWYSTVDEGGSELCNLSSRLPSGAAEWTDAEPFWDGPDVNDHAPKLWVDAKGTIFHFARGWYENIVRTSADNGYNWSPARIMPTFGEFGNQLLQTKAGRLILTHDSQQTSLVTSDDAGATWSAPSVKGKESDFRPGGKGFRHAGIHAPIVELADGRLMTIGRYDKVEDQRRFDMKTPISYSSDGGATWTYEASEFPAISSVQRAVLMRLAEGPLLLCSFTDERREWDQRKGMKFAATGADGKPSEFTGFGLFATLSFDEGKTWPVRRLITPGGPDCEAAGIDRLKFTLGDTMAEPSGYLTACQTRDGTIQLLSSKNHYAFTPAWLKALPKMPK